MIDFESIGVTSISAKHFKCFGEEPHGFEEVKPFNVIIGRNNSGKSSLLDIISYFIDPSLIENLSDRQGRNAEFLVSKTILPDDLSSQQFPGREHQFSEATGRSVTVRNMASWSVANLKGKLVLGRLLKGNAFQFVDYVGEYNPENKRNEEVVYSQIHDRLKSVFKNPFSGSSYARLLADRDIVPETSDTELGIASNGRGFSNTIQSIVNLDRYNRDLVEDLLLSELNVVFNPDACFSRVLVEQLESGEWEVFLEEPRKGRVRLSQMGSGVKTVLLVLAFLHVVPTLTNHDASQTIYCFEELENNLHPAIQRRLFAYLRNKAEEIDTNFFVTTHSNVVIDMFTNDDSAQLIHITSDGESSSARRVDTWDKSCSVLDDLDIRASDILQTNVVVWVEGPSDRIYFRRWIDLWSDGSLVEGIHYQCLSFGGSLNAHLAFDDPEYVEEVLAAMRINRNAILLIDSDKRNESDDLKRHSDRLLAEIKDNRGYGWVTLGREVENYIPVEVLRLYLGNATLKGPGKYKDMLQYLAEKKGNNNPHKKTFLAHSICRLISKDMIPLTLDLAPRLNDVVKEIKFWNRVE